VKNVARQLLRRVRVALVLDWRQRAQARAQVRIAIEDALDEGLPRAYTPDVYQQKCAAIFEHVFERFPNGGEDATREGLVKSSCNGLADPEAASIDVLPDSTATASRAAMTSRQARSGRHTRSPSAEGREEVAR